MSVKLIGDLDGEVPFNDTNENLNDLGTAIINIYTLMSFDNYPDVMLPSYCK